MPAAPRRSFVRGGVHIHSPSRSSASARVGATAMAIISPTWRTLPHASTCWATTLNSGMSDVAMMGRISRSSLMKTACAPLLAGVRMLKSGHGPADCAETRPPPLLNREASFGEASDDQDGINIPAREGDQL